MNRLLKRASRILFVFLLVFSWGSISRAADGLKTPAEAAGYARYSQHEDIARFLSALDHASSEMRVRIIGQTREVRGFPAKDLFLAIVNEEGAESPGKINRARPTILIIASQHGNEQSAKEAALRFLRDLAAGELKGLLKTANFLIIPQANPYGNQFDRRQNEDNLDLNRDHVKLESAETRAIHRVFREWMPEVSIDLHEKGDDYYRVSIGCVSNANIGVRLQEFSRTTILAEVRKSLEKKKVTFFEYLVTQEMGLDSSAGIRYRPDELAGRERMMRYSTTDLNDGRNSLGIYETLSFIQEGASRHDIETLERRTRWQYWGLRSFVEAVAGHAEEAVRLVGEHRSGLLGKAKTYSEADLVHLRMTYVRDERQPTLTIRSFERPASPVRGVLKVDKKAGDPVTADELSSYSYPSDNKLVKNVVENWFPGVEPVLSVSRPLGYIIPAKHQDVVENLLDHGLEVGLLVKDKILEAEAFAAMEVMPAEYDYLPPERIEGEKRSLEYLAKKGDYFVSCAQPGANLIPCLLEPQSQYGLIRYRAFGLVPEPGDVFAFFRVVKPADLPVVPYRDWQ
ncbi:MAG: DUF2817 domain-containing protein [Candidatus Aminicenantes bacterium]|nr:DUF2817 domain-containing protein [Candidatus Aminicenantes bacterium]